MTREDLRILSTALSLVAVLIKDDHPENRTQRVNTLAHLIETYCLDVMVSDATEEGLEEKVTEDGMLLKVSA